MNRVRHPTVLRLLLSIVLVAGGCGGGGGGNGGDKPQQLLINAGNAELAGGEALRALVIMNDATEFGRDLVDIIVSVPGAPRLAAKGAALLVDGVCEQGTVDLGISDVPPADELSVGDSAEITFDQCLMGESTFNGALFVSVTEVEATASSYPVPPYNVTFALEFASLSISDSAGTAGISGEAELNLESLVPFVYISRLSGTSLTIRGDGFFESLSEFSFVHTGAHILQGAGRCTSSDLGGDFVVFETTEDFIRTEPDDYPNSGVMVVSGALSSTLTVTALDSTMVEMALDGDGDGAIDLGYPIEVLWNELDL